MSVRHAFLKCHIMMSNLPSIGYNMARLCLQIILKLNWDDQAFTWTYCFEVMSVRHNFHFPTPTSQITQTRPPYPTTPHTVVPTVYHLHTALYRYRNNNLRYSVRPSHFFCPVRHKFLAVMQQNYITYRLHIWWLTFQSCFYQIKMNQSFMLVKIMYFMQYIE